MKTNNKHNNYEKFILRLKLFVISPILFLSLCSFDDTCSGGSEPVGCNGSVPPPDPVISISFTQVSGKGKFFFTTDQRIVLQKIDVWRDSLVSVETITFQFPYLVCEPGTSHIIHEYDNVEPGHTWKFIFEGISKTTGSAFSEAVSYQIY